MPWIGSIDDLLKRTLDLQSPEACAKRREAEQQRRKDQESAPCER